MAGDSGVMAYDEGACRIRLAPMLPGMAVDPVRLAYEIRREREKQDLSQSELARRASSHQAVISKIEKGEHELQFDLLGRVCEALLGPKGLGILLYRSGHIVLDVPLAEMISSAPELTPESRAMLRLGYEQAVSFDAEGKFIPPASPS